MVLRPFLQPERPLSSQEFGLRLQVQAAGIELVTPNYSPSAIHHPMCPFNSMFQTGIGMDSTIYSLQQNLTGTPRIYLITVKVSGPLRKIAAKFLPITE